MRLRSCVAALTAPAGRWCSVTECARTFQRLDAAVCAGPCRGPPRSASRGRTGIFRATTGAICLWERPTGTVRRKLSRARAAPASSRRRRPRDARPSAIRARRGPRAASPAWDRSCSRLPTGRSAAGCRHASPPGRRHGFRRRARADRSGAPRPRHRRACRARAPPARRLPGRPGHPRRTTWSLSRRHALACTRWPRQRPASARARGAAAIAAHAPASRSRAFRIPRRSARRAPRRRPRRRERAGLASVPQPAPASPCGPAPSPSRPARQRSPAPGRLAPLRLPQQHGSESASGARRACSGAEAAARPP